jgi:hypothetical protein
MGAPRAQRIDQRAEYGLGSSVVLGQVASGRELLLQAHDRFVRVGERGRLRALTVPHAARIDQAFDDGAILVTPTTPIRAEFVPFLVEAASSTIAAPRSSSRTPAGIASRSVVAGRACCGWCRAPRTV